MAGRGQNVLFGDSTVRWFSTRRAGPHDAGHFPQQRAQAPPGRARQRLGARCRARCRSAGQSVQSEAAQVAGTLRVPSAADVAGTLRLPPVRVCEMIMSEKSHGTRSVPATWAASSGRRARRALQQFGRANSRRFSGSFCEGRRAEREDRLGVFDPAVLRHRHGLVPGDDHRAQPLVGLEAAMDRRSGLRRGRDTSSPSGIPVMTNHSRMRVMRPA